MKRLFIAIPISAAIQKKALEFQKTYKNLPVRWLTGKNLHITIIPPWYENDPDRIKNILNEFSAQANTAQIETTRANKPHVTESSANASPAINIKFSNIFYGPNPAAPRLIWASGQTPTKLIQFKKNLETIFLQEKIIKKIEPRPFLLHLTLARLPLGMARFRQEDFKNFSIKKISEQIDWSETLDTFVLMESHLSSAGADYEILQKNKIFFGNLKYGQ